MNLKENYKRLFAGKVRSNDASILREAKYNIKVTKHDVRSKEKGAKGFAVTYEGTISGPGIPNGTEWYGNGIAGDVIDAKTIPGWNPDGKDGYWSTLAITIQMDFQPHGEVWIYHESDKKDQNKDERREWETESKPTHIFTKAVKDELAPMFSDAIVKYALSRGLEDHVAEKSGGTFNMEVATNAIAKSKKSSSFKKPKGDILKNKDFIEVVEIIADGAEGGENMTDDIVDELGDFYDGVYDSNDQELIDAYDDLRSTIDGEPNEQAEAANKLLDVIG